LRLDVERQICNLWRIKTFLKEGYPIGVNVEIDTDVEDSETGAHSATVVGYRKKNNIPELKIPNLHYKSDRHGWVKWRDLKEILSLRGRDFGIVEDYGRPGPYMWVFRLNGKTKKASRKRRTVHSSPS
jgi:hypothetical protein